MSDCRCGVEVIIGHADYCPMGKEIKIKALIKDNKAMRNRQATLKKQIDELKALIKPVLEKADILIDAYCADDRHEYPELDVVKLLNLLVQL